MEWYKKMWPEIFNTPATLRYKSFRYLLFQKKSNSFDGNFHRRFAGLHYVDACRWQGHFN